MGIHARDRTSTKSYVAVWDPHDVLEIINPVRGYFSCVGYAHSKHRRCQNRIGQYNLQEVYELLDSISLFSPSSKEVEVCLHEIAFKSLCTRWHKDQADDVVEEWKMRLCALDRSGRRRNDKTNNGTSKSYGARSDRPGVYQQSFSSHGNQARDKTYEPHQQRRTSEENAKEQKWRDEDDIRSERTRDNPRQPREEQRQRKAREHEQERKEQERKASEERKQEKEREQARKARQREAEQTRAKEQAMRERREWQQAWHSYVTKWAAFKALEDSEKPSNVEDVHRQVPWPTKTGRFRDLKMSNVKEFYRNAYPDAETPDKMSKTMRAESMKWHPDKAKLLYHNCEPGVADKEVLKMICLAVLELKEQADAAKGR